MRTKRSNGTDHESLPSVAEYTQVTEGRLVLLALRDALQRMNYACRVTIYTESAYIAGAVNNCWPQAWAGNGWKNAKGKEVQDKELWSRILELAGEAGHELAVEAGAHEFVPWMRWQMPLAEAYPEVFSEIEERPVQTCR